MPNIKTNRQQWQVGLTKINRLGSQMKKVIAIFSLLLCIVITFLSLKLQQFKQQTADFLAKQHIVTTTDQLSFQLLPFALVAENIQYDLNKQWRINIPQLQVLLNLSDIWSGKIHIDSIALSKAKLYSTQNNFVDNIEQINLTLKPTALWLNHFTLKQPLAFDAQLQFYYKQQPYQLDITNANWLIKSEQLYQIIADHIKINQAKLDQVAIQYQPSQIYFRSKQGNLDFYQQQNGYAVIGKNIDIYAFWAALDIRSIITGRSNLTGFIQFKNAQIPAGELHFEVHQGTIKGVNLLNLIAQYLPINYDENQLTQLNTTFNLVKATMLWDQQRLLVKQLEIQASPVLLQGNGEVGLLNGECDFRTTLNLNNSKYQKINLPIHFFGSCHSPQYKIEINKNLRNQFKDMFKKRFR